MRTIKGELSLPGDKSISHRSALFAAMYNGESEFTNFNFNADCTATLSCLRKLGIHWKAEKDRLILWGKHPSRWSAPDSVLDAMNSGTTARLLSGLLSGLTHKTMINGDASLRKRPMKRIIEPLTQMGAHLEATSGRLPMTFYPVPSLQGITYELPMASAQVKSAILLAGLLANGTTVVREPVQTRDHTERLLQLPARIDAESGLKEISSARDLDIPNISMPVPGDISSAAFFLVAAASLPGSELVIKNVSLNPTRTGIIGVLNSMGADLETELLRNVPEPTGHIRIRYTPMKAVVIEPSMIANIIDELPVLTILATQADGVFEVSGAEELRHKESDRIRVMVDNLRNVGVEVREKKDGMLLEGPQKIKGGTVQTFGDHRIAMSFAVAGLLSEEDITIDDPGCVSVSFPDFWKLLERFTYHDSK